MSKIGGVVAAKMAATGDNMKMTAKKNEEREKRDRIKINVTTCSSRILCSSNQIIKRITACGALLQTWRGITPRTSSSRNPRAAAALRTRRRAHRVRRYHHGARRLRYARTRASLALHAHARARDARGSGERRKHSVAGEKKKICAGRRVTSAKKKKRQYDLISR